MRISPRVRVLLISMVAIASLVVIVWVMQKRFGYSNLHQSQVLPAATPSATTPTETTPAPVASPTTQSSSPTPDDPGFDAARPTPSNQANLTILEPSYLGRLNLVIPVQGVKPEQLLDTFGDARSEGRAHDAIDIPAAAGTPVIAVAAGEIVKLFSSERGGITIYQFSADKKLVFYYAHLQRYAEGLTEGRHMRQGEVIAYVGDTGNAGAGNYHLHFSIAIVADPKRHWEGTNINPYPLLRK